MSTNAPVLLLAVMLFTVQLPYSPVVALEPLQSLSSLNARLKSNPEDWHALFQRSIVLGLRQNYDGALADINKAVNLRPNDYKCYSNRGTIYAWQKKYAKAAENYTYALRLHPGDKFILSQRASAFWGMGARQKQIDDLTTALKLAGKRTFKTTDEFLHIKSDDKFTEMLLIRRGEAYHSLRNTPGATKNFDDAATTDFKAALKLNPNSAKAFNGLGLVHSSQDKYRQSFEDFSHASLCNPEDAIAQANRGLSCCGMKQYKRAIACLTLAISLDPGFALAYKNRGAAYAEIGELKLAESDMNKALELNAADPVSFQNRAKLSVKTGNYEQATADFVEFGRLQPPRLTQDAIDVERFAPILSGYDRMIANNLGSWETMYDRGIAEMCLGKLQNAVSDLNQYLKNAPSAGIASRATAVIWCSTALREMHRESESQSELDKFLLEAQNKNTWPLPIVQYLHGTLASEMLLKQASTPAFQTEARCFIGLNNSASKNLALAIKNLQWVHDHGDATSDAYFLAKNRLQALTKSKS